jgi:hypothetical protein
MCRDLAITAISVDSSCSDPGAPVRCVRTGRMSMRRAVVQGRARRSLEEDGAAPPTWHPSKRWGSGQVPARSLFRISWIFS